MASWSCQRRTVLSTSWRRFDLRRCVAAHPRVVEGDPHRSVPSLKCDVVVFDPGDPARERGNQRLDQLRARAARNPRRLGGAERDRFIDVPPGLRERAPTHVGQRDHPARPAELHTIEVEAAAALVHRHSRRLISEDQLRGDLERRDVRRPTPAGEEAQGRDREVGAPESDELTAGRFTLAQRVDIAEDLVDRGPPDPDPSLPCEALGRHHLHRVGHNQRAGCGPIAQPIGE